MNNTKNVYVCHVMCYNFLNDYEDLNMIKHVRSVVMAVAVTISCNAMAISQSDQQRIDDLSKQIEQLRANSKQDKSTDDKHPSKNEILTQTVDAVQQISVIGAGAITATAKGIGAAASDFAKTPAGMVVTVGAIYHFIGDSLLDKFMRIFVKPFLILAVAFIGYRLFIKLCIDVVEYENLPGRTILFGLWTTSPKRQIKKISYIASGAYYAQHFFVGLVTLAFALMCVLM